jgi:hypothetical protein
MMLLTADGDPESAGLTGRPSTGRIEPASVPAAQASGTGKEPPGLWSPAEGRRYTGFARPEKPEIRSQKVRSRKIRKPEGGGVSFWFLASDLLTSDSGPLWGYLRVGCCKALCSLTYK